MRTPIFSTIQNSINLMDTARSDLPSKNCRLPCVFYVSIVMLGSLVDIILFSEIRLIWAGTHWSALSLFFIIPLSNNQVQIIFCAAKMSFFYVDLEYSKAGNVANLSHLRMR